MKRSWTKAIVVACALIGLSHPARAVVNGQIDTFEDGTTMNWANGFPANLVNISTGGPAGVGDHYLQLSSDGSGSGGKLTTFNLQQWLGNYISQGVTAIEIDLRNTGATTLHMRLAFKSQNLMNSPGYLSAPVTLAPGSGWQHFTFSLAQANMIAVGGPVAYNTFFSSGIGDARIINEVGTADLNGDSIVGQVSIDNIHAVPEPATGLLILSGLIAIMFVSRRLVGSSRKA